jgi:hypothetical protein
MSDDLQNPQRSPSGIGVPAEPFTEAGLSRLCEGLGAAGIEKPTVLRLLATIAARDAEIERLRAVERAARTVVEEYDYTFARHRVVTPLSFLGIVTLKAALETKP